MPSQRSRTVAASILLAAAAVFIAVAASQWLFGFMPDMSLPRTGPDPRDDLFRRAAGWNFTDDARQTLFSIVPVAAPAAAVLLRPGRVIRRLAHVLYAALLVIGVLLALSAAAYGFDQATQLENEGQVFIDTRSSIERLVLDGTWLVLAGLAWWSVRWSGKRE